MTSIASVSVIPASIPYQHTELSSVVARRGVTDVVIKLMTDSGEVGWGEACSGADTKSVIAAVEAMVPFVVGRSYWDGERIKKEMWLKGLWHLHEPTANFAWAGIDMALLDLCGKVTGQPLHRLLGGALRDEVDYFYYLSWDSDEDLVRQCKDGLDAGYKVFYLKVGVSFEDDLRRVALIRDTIGRAAKLRLDANGAWSVPEAIRNIRVLAEFDIDFFEQPVRENPPSLMRRIRSLEVATIASNEGLWTEADALSRILHDVSDVYCFSPYWVGSVRSFQFLGALAGKRGAFVCKHTHGEFAIAAAAGNHVLVTLPYIVDGNQQTSSLMEFDLARVPIAAGPRWESPTEPGLGIHVDEEALHEAAARYERDGQFLPYGDSIPMASRPDPSTDRR